MISSCTPLCIRLLFVTISLEIVAGLTLTSTQKSLGITSSSFLFPIHHHSRRTDTRKNNNRQSSRSLQMRDASSAYWFKVGDKVTVTSSVMKAGVDLRGRDGIVTEAWEKCDVDPTCCCAEFVDDNFAVCVEFRGPLQQEQRLEQKEKPSLIKGLDDDKERSFTHYFNENELDKGVSVDESAKLSDSTDTITSAVPFDGMSCQAFKLDQLKMGEQAKRIAAYEASKEQDSSQ